mmetsp:Transcript_36192/g.65672  ORF Transcript_36192/g.65672 Transcript_36192/m.65672 type:complete len:311 (+) Transcript_36192:62-994(+)
MTQRKLAVDFQLEHVEMDYMRHETELDMRLWMHWTTLEADASEWMPEWLPANGTQDMRIVDDSGKTQDKGDYDAYTSIRFVQKFRTQMDLHEFPFDSHVLTAKLRFPRVHKHKIESVTLLGKRKHQYINLGDLQIVGVSSSIEITDPENKNFKPELHIHLSVERQANVYVLSIYMPLFLLGLSGFGTYLIPEDDYADRLGSLLALIFASVGYQLVVSGKLPSLSYLTLLDRYTTGVFLFVCAILLHIILDRALHEFDLIGESTCSSIGVLIAAAAFAGGHVFYVIYAIRIPSCRGLPDQTRYRPIDNQGS